MGRPKKTENELEMQVQEAAVDVPNTFTAKSMGIHRGDDGRYKVIIFQYDPNTFETKVEDIIDAGENMNLARGVWKVQAVERGLV